MWGVQVAAEPTYKELEDGFRKSNTSLKTKRKGGDLVRPTRAWSGCAPIRRACRHMRCWVHSLLETTELVLERSSDRMVVGLALGMAVGGGAVCLPSGVAVPDGKAGRAKLSRLRLRLQLQQGLTCSSPPNHQAAEILRCSGNSHCFSVG